MIVDLDGIMYSIEGLAVIRPIDLSVKRDDNCLLFSAKVGKQRDED